LNGNLFSAAEPTPNTEPPAVWSFTVGGQVVPWQRTGQGKRRFTPKRTRDYQTIVATIAAFRRPDGWPFEDKEARFAILVDCYMGDLRGRDLDNCGKTIKDALEGIAYYNDRQIDDGHVRRGRGAECSEPRGLDRENPRVEITLSVL